MTHAVYLDHNATTPPRPGVAEAVAEALALGGNPSSVHARGRAARALVERARESVAALVGADRTGVIFTSGGTEANTIALRGTDRRRIFISATEHDSVWSAVSSAETIPVDGDGLVNLTVLDEMLAASDGLALVSVMLANNETGIVQPVADIAAVARAHGALVHSDTVQAAGKIPVDMATLGVDFLSLSAHKIGGPQGVGALIHRTGIDFAPMVRGGGQEGGMRGGTENVAGIAGFGLAASQAAAELDTYARLADLRDGLEVRIKALSPGSQFIGAHARRLPNTSCFDLPGVKSDTQVMALDLAGVMVSAGSACHSGRVKSSRILTAMGVTPSVATSVIRVSLGRETQQSDLNRFVEAWSSLGQRGAA